LRIEEDEWERIEIDSKDLTFTFLASRSLNSSIAYTCKRGIYRILGFEHLGD
jgi:hypothetical protein